MSLGRKIATGFGLSLVMLLAVSALAMYGIAVLSGTTQELMESEATLQQARMLYTAMADTEALQRNYLITGQEEYLRRYQSTAAAASADMEELTKASASSEARTRRAALLPPLIESRFNSLAEGARIRQAQGRDPALDYVMRSTGNALMEQLRRA